jgi:hypothetical protein
LGGSYQTSHLMTIVLYAKVVKSGAPDLYVILSELAHGLSSSTCCVWDMSKGMVVVGDQFVDYEIDTGVGGGDAVIKWNLNDRVTTIGSIDQDTVCWISPVCNTGDIKWKPAIQRFLRVWQDSQHYCPSLGQASDHQS